MNIIALDPGGTTGLAWWRDGHFMSHQVGPDEHHLDLWHLLSAEAWDQVVCERFDYRNKSRAGLEIISREYIGVAKLWCTINKVPLELQTAAQAKGFVPDKVLKRFEIWVPGKPHAMDAYRHLLFFLANSNVLDERSKKDFLQIGWTS